MLEDWNEVLTGLLELVALLPTPVAKIMVVTVVILGIVGWFIRRR